jgi:hypothetical protein
MRWQSRSAWPLRIGATIVAGSLLALAGPSSGAVGARTSARASAHTTPLASTVLGIYTGTDQPSDVGAFNRIVGARVHWVMQFDPAVSWDVIGSYNRWALATWSKLPYRMVWGIPMLPSGKPSGVGKPCCGATLATEATGAYNQYFTQFGTALVANNQANAVLRIGAEFNGDWDAWAAPGQVHNFIAAYRQVVGAFRAVPGSHFVFDWNPIISDVGTGDPGSYYPGDAYVDNVGFDVYDTAWKHYPGAKQEWKNLLTERYGLNWLVGFARLHHKPLSLPEWGLGWGPAHAGLPVNGPGAVQGGDNGYFVTQMAAWCRSHNVAFATYYEPTGPLTGGRNPRTAAALKQSWG